MRAKHIKFLFYIIHDKQKNDCKIKVSTFNLMREFTNIKSKKFIFIFNKKTCKIIVFIQHICDPLDG